MKLNVHPQPIRDGQPFLIKPRRLVVAIQLCKKHPNLRIINHPILLDELSRMRNKETAKEDFARHMDQVAPFLAYEALSDLSIEYRIIETPVAAMSAPFLSSRKVALVSVLGAGEAFRNGMWRNLLPWAPCGMIAARRNEQTLKAELTYTRLPKKLHGWKTLVVDPMLATGGSSSDAIDLLKRETGADDIMLVSLVAAPMGVDVLHERHPNVVVYTLALDSSLTKNGYINPGLGDAGDRYFGVTPNG